MPRFDNEGFNPKKRIDNDSRDRSVPEDENYYGKVNYNFDNSVVDNQDEDNYSYPSYPNKSQNGIQNKDSYFNSFEAGRTERNAQNRQMHSDKPKNKRSSDKKPHSKNKGKQIGFGILAIVLAVLVALFGTVFSAMGKITHDDKRKNEYVSSSELKHSSKVKNILLLGVDARDPDDDTKSRSDSMMLISIDSEHKCIKMTSFLRDTWVYIPSADSKQRLNAACSYDGYNGVVDTIEYNFGVDIDGYVVADFEMFKVLVDAVGGVEVDVTKAEADEVTNHEYRYDGVKLDEGKYKLSGEQALAYCRIRKIDTDFQRAYRQRTVMQAVMKSIKSANPLKLASMATKCAPYIQTNLSNSYIMSAAVSALSCMDTMVESRVPFDGTWKYETIKGNSVITIDADKNKQMLIDNIYNKTADEIKSENEN